MTVALMLAWVRPVGVLVQLPGGALQGRVIDLSGQQLPGATVTMFPEQGGKAVATTVDSSGALSFEAVPAGFYRIDVQLTGFSSRRRNHVGVNRNDTSDVEIALAVRPLCECVVAALPRTAAAPLEGRAMSEPGWPVPHSLLEVVDGRGRRLDTAYTDSDGRFIVKVPGRGSWTLRSLEPGFEAASVKVSRSTVGPVVLSLRYRGTGVARMYETLGGCCRSFLFLHDGP